MYDALGYTAAAAGLTSTASFTVTPVMDLGPSAVGTPRRGYNFDGLVGLTANGATAVGQGTAIFQIFAGTSTGSLNLISQQLEAPFNLTAGVNSNFHIPFQTDNRYVAAVVVISGTGAATVPWKGDITYVRPF